MSQITPLLNTSIFGSARDRRSLQRFSVWLDGMADLSGRPTPCKIQNVCAGGLFMTFSQAPDPIIPGSEITIHFPLKEGRFRSDACLTGRVVHSSTDAAGIAFVSPDPKVLRALLSFGTNRPQPSLPDPGDAQDELPLRIDAAGRHRLLEECNKLATQSLKPILKSALLTLGHRLFHAARSTQTVTDQDACFAAMDQLKLSEGRLLSAFGDALHRRWRSLGSPTAHPAEDRHNTTADDLHLVDDESLENWLAVSEIASGAETRHREQLAGLDQRLSVVLGTHIDSAANPYGPRLVAESFQEVILAESYLPLVNRLACRAFHDILTERAGALYERLNQFLIEEKVLPELKLYSLRRQPLPAPTIAPQKEASFREVTDVPPQTGGRG